MMHDDWLPISDYPLPEFDPGTWYMSAPNVLVWTGNRPSIASYSYTQKGKGRWRDWRGVVTPTHWMPLPGPPTTGGGAPTADINTRTPHRRVRHE